MREKSGTDESTPQNYRKPQELEMTVLNVGLHLEPKTQKLIKICKKKQLDFWIPSLFS